MHILQILNHIHKYVNDTAIYETVSNDAIYNDIVSMDITPLHYRINLGILGCPTIACKFLRGYINNVKFDVLNISGMLHILYKCVPLLNSGQYIIYHNDNDTCYEMSEIDNLLQYNVRFTGFTFKNLSHLYAKHCHKFTGTKIHDYHNTGGLQFKEDDYSIVEVSYHTHDGTLCKDNFTPLAKCQNLRSVSLYLCDDYVSNEYECIDLSPLWQIYHIFIHNIARTYSPIITLPPNCNSLKLHNSFADCDKLNIHFTNGHQIEWLDIEWLDEKNAHYLDPQKFVEMFPYVKKLTYGEEQSHIFDKINNNHARPNHCATQ